MEDQKKKKPLDIVSLTYCPDSYSWKRKPNIYFLEGRRKENREEQWHGSCDRDRRQGIQTYSSSVLI